MPRVLKRPQAEIDLLEIWSFISQDSFEAADRFLDWLEARFDLIATQPHMGRERPELRPGLRSFPVGNHIVFYTPIEDGIILERVLRGSQDIEALFRE